MSDLTDDQVKALLDGATPGPWRADGEPWNRVVWSPNGNRVCFMAHSSGLNDARDIATSNLVAAAPDLARALLDARAEHAASLIRINAEAVEAVAQARADAQAAVSVVVEKAAERLDANRAHLNFAALLGLLRDEALPEPVVTTLSDWLDGIAAAIRALAPADGLAAVEALRVEARENAMQALASMGQAQEAYEAQLEAEAELARVRADAAAAQALVVSELRQFVTDSYQCGCMDAGCAGRHAERNSTLEALSETLDALSAADGLAAVEALRERAEKAEQERDRIDQWRETAIVERDTYSEERDAAEGRVAELRGALEYYADTFCEGFCKDLPQAGTYQPEMDLDCSGCKARAALAQTPTDPGDGWTWNERLGWIGPDGKPAGRGGA